MIKLQIYYEEEDNQQEIYFPKTGGNLNELKMIIKKTFPNINSNFKIIREQDNQEIKSISNITFEEAENLLIRDDRNNENNFLGLPFIDVTNPENRISQQLEEENSENIPTWRTLRPGLNFIGNCRDHKTVLNSVYNSSSCYNYDFTNTSGLMTCPECSNQFIIDNICFYKCYYNFYGVKYKNGNLEKFGKEITDFENVNIDEHNFVNVNGESYKINKTKPGNFVYFNSEKDEKVKFLELIFQIKIYE